jgi:hypothetical protein
VTKPAGADGARTVIEVKRHLDGTEQRFETELVHRTAGSLVVLYRLPDAPSGPLDSYGCYWAGRTYICYHMVRAHGSPDAGREVVTRFDVARDVEIADAEVRFLDLLLDLWVEDGGSPGGIARWEDEDEVAAALRSGLLSPADGAYVERARRTLEQGHRRVVQEIRWLLRRLGRLPSGEAT